jgi:hypothetical protein
MLSKNLRKSMTPTYSQRRLVEPIGYITPTEAEETCYVKI